MSALPPITPRGRTSVRVEAASGFTARPGFVFRRSSVRSLSAPGGILQGKQVKKDPFWLFRVSSEKGWQPAVLSHPLNVAAPAIIPFRTGRSGAEKGPGFFLGFLDHPRNFSAEPYRDSSLWGLYGIFYFHRHAGLAPRALDLHRPCRPVQAGQPDPHVRPCVTAPVAGETAARVLALHELPVTGSRYQPGAGEP